MGSRTPGGIAIGIIRLFILVLLLSVLPLSTAESSPSILKTLSHSLHYTNYRQTLHWPERSTIPLLPGSVPHPVAINPYYSYITDYYGFWHGVIEVLPELTGEDLSKYLYLGFIALKTYVVVHNNTIDPERSYWMIHHEIHF